MLRKKVDNELNTLMYERRSIRKYDVSVKISRDEMAKILQDATTAPSSLNLQPWRFIVIDSAEGKELIRPHLQQNMIQLETSAAIIAVFGDLENFSYTEKILDGTVAIGAMTQVAKDSLMPRLNEYIANISQNEIRDIILIDSGLVSMQIMLSAKAYGYDTNAIGGYRKNELTEALGLDLKRYVPIMLISIGKADDKGYESVRFPISEITSWR